MGGKNKTYFSNPNNNLIKFDFKTTNINLKIFSEFEKLAKNDIQNKNTKRKIGENTISLFKSNINITGIDKSCLNQDFNKSSCKKLFHNVYNKKTDIYKGIVESNISNNKNKKNNPENLHFFTTKKHYEKIAPGYETARLSDKNYLLPTEYRSKHFRGNSAYSASSLSLTINKTKNLNPTQDDTKYMNRKLSRIPKENYPYAKDNMESLLKSEVNFRNENVTGKINSNSFNILKLVKKYDWETK